MAFSHASHRTLLAQYGVNVLAATQQLGTLQLVTATVSVQLGLDSANNLLKLVDLFVHWLFGAKRLHHLLQYRHALTDHVTPFALASLLVILTARQ